MPVSDLTRRIRYFVSTGSDVSIVDGFTNAITKTINTGLGATEVVLGSDDRVYVANAGSDTISAICINGTVKTYNIANNGFLDVYAEDAKLYVANGTTVTVNDLLSGSLIGTINGFTNAQYIKLNKSYNLLFVVDTGDNSVKVISTVTLTEIFRIPTGLAPNFILLSEDGTKAYISNSGSASITVVNLIDYSVLATIPLGVGVVPYGLTIFGNILYVANTAGSVIPVNIITNTLLAPIVLGGSPQQITLSPDKTRLYVTNFANLSLNMIDPLTNVLIGSIGGFISGPIYVVGAYEGSLISPGDPIDLTDSYQLDDISESVCIITNKVFAHCQQRVCFPNVTVDSFPATGGPFVIEKISFGNGFIVPGTEVRVPIPERPNFSRVQFVLRVPYTIEYRNAAGVTGEITGFLPDIDKDVILFIPEARDEFSFDIVVETRSEILNNPSFINGVLNFAVGVFIVYKVVGEVQLLIPAFGYCPAPPECEEWIEPPGDDVCERFIDFTLTPFPEDFFPYQYEDINCLNS
ncbi:YncE family protein [Clostridium sp. OS1-26]|uniref:YncE family protein n=1 Tax=Clostridium sp. OS1-26 TaxID=3070681 RepID=UPI0027E0DFF7|nr:YncE family protein [Clostridium sp. OS1-26]WML35828.1 YncE family protein [Clostridium sp. OS1-26]